MCDILRGKAVGNMAAEILLRSLHPPSGQDAPVTGGLHLPLHLAVQLPVISGEMLSAAILPCRASPGSDLGARLTCPELFPELCPVFSDAY